jgi:lia operon protein LiaG
MPLQSYALSVVIPKPLVLAIINTVVQCVTSFDVIKYIYKEFLESGSDMKKILVTFLVIMCIYLLFFQSSIFSWSIFDNESKEATVTSSVNLIEIDVSSASTTIIPDNTNILRADLDGKGKVTVNKKGDQISVHYKRKWFEGGLPFFNKSKLTIYIPENYDRDMSIEVGSGNLAYSGPSKIQPMVLEELKVELSSGNVELENFTTKTFKHDGSSGNIQIDSLTTANGILDISSGNINLNNYSGGLKADLSSGNLAVQMDEMVGPIDIEVNSGRVSLDLPKNASFTLNGDVSSGHIDNQFLLENKVADKKKVKGTYSNGKYDIDLDVSSGSIDIF